MKIKNIAVFTFAVAVSFLAATYRFGDSAHSIGIIKAGGGEARHASHFDRGRDRYMLIATATVIPPYSGDARVVLEGMPAMDHELYLSGPVVDVGLNRFPKLKGDTILGLRPMDRLALWVKIKPPQVDPVCGMAHGPGFIRSIYHDRQYAFCSQMCVNEFFDDPAKYKDEDTVRGRYELAFYDTKTDRRVLGVPLVFGGKEDEADEGGHQH